MQTQKIALSASSSAPPPIHVCAQALTHIVRTNTLYTVVGRV